MPIPPPTDRQARLIWLAVSAVALTVIITFLGLLVWGTGKVLAVLSPVLWPLAIAGVLAYLLDPIVDLLETKGLPRTRAIIVVFALAATLFLGLLGSVVPTVVREARDLTEEMPSYANRLQERVDGWMTNTNSLLRRTLQLLPGLDSNPQTENTETNSPSPSETSLAEEPQIASTDTPATAITPTTESNQPPTPTSDPGFWNQLVAAGHVQSATRWLASLLPTLGSWLFGEVTRVASWFGVLAGLALIPVYLFYFLLEKKGISSQWTHYLPVADSKFKEELAFVLGSINDYLIAFFRGQVLVALCDGILYAIGFLAIGLPMAVLIGVVASVLTIIPYIGSIITCGAAILIAAVHFGDILHPLLAVSVFAVVQVLEGFVIQPKIVGDRVGLHPLTIIIALMIGTSLFGGVLGGILAIPFTAAARVLMFRYVWRTPAPENPAG
ncbi:MAG: AI-2E family transporter [Limisphaerales bacterium]|jgi:predicted PurR-regulated permease PerM